MLKCALVALIVAGSFGVVGPRGAHAAGPVVGFNIVQWTAYCRNNTTTCYPGNPKQLSDMALNVVNLHGQSSGKPDAVFAFCEQYFISPFAGPTYGHLMSFYEAVRAVPGSGLILGSATVDPGASETSLYAKSTLNLQVWDASLTHDRVRIWGTSVTNNTDGTPPRDFLESGGVVLAFSGPRHLFDFTAGSDLGPFDYGEIGCHSTNITPVATSQLPTPVFENLFGSDPDGDSPVPFP